jgi:murein DD-endopeptidase MepM/ murein hydrolase activator NlpD
MISSPNAKSLKQLKNELARDEANKAALIAKQKTIESKITKMNKEISSMNSKITDNQNKIEESKEKIKSLNKDIDEKKKEIDNLVSFLQVSNKDNVYLEYVFEAKTFSDFIYRSAVVEQITKYNDELIESMSNLIDENKNEQEKLNKKIDESEDTIDDLNEMLVKYNLTMDDLVDDHKDAKAEYEASKKEVAAYEKLYKQYNCKETTSILDCVSVPYADGFVRPLKAGTITSEYGLRYHPTLHYYRMHNGIDIGTAMNTTVYSAAAGIVSKIVTVANPNKKNSSCGGNKVYVKHRVNGKEYTSVYMHLHSISVKLNQYVTITSVIGKSGGGESYDYCTTGPHLHFGILKGSTYENPRNYVNFPKLGKRFTSRF